MGETRMAMAMATTWPMAGCSSSGVDERGLRHPRLASSAMSSRRLPRGTRVGSGTRSRRTRVACFRGRGGASHKIS